MAKGKKTEKITIDDVEYNLDDLSTEVPTHKYSVRDAQLQQLNNECGLRHSVSAIRMPLNVSSEKQLPSKPMGQKIKVEDTNTTII